MIADKRRCSFTQIWDRAHHGSAFFEDLIRENLDLGRPEQVPLIFARKMPRKTATDGRCRTRIIPEAKISTGRMSYDLRRLTAAFP